jgi:hypothetical protein
MPGEMLTFFCSCGYRKGYVAIGGTSQGECKVFICTHCKTIFSIYDNNPDRKRFCKKCGSKLLSITDAGAWQPEELHKKYSDCEPWDLEYKALSGEELTEADRMLIPEIKILCPRCREYSLQHEYGAFWD